MTRQRPLAKNRATKSQTAPSSCITRINMNEWCLVRIWTVKLVESPGVMLQNRGFAYHTLRHGPRRCMKGRMPILNECHK